MRFHAALLLLAVAPAIARAQASPRQAGALRSEAKTWTTPFEKDGRPRDPFADAQGRVWFTGNTNGRIARLDPATGKMTNYMMPDPAIKDPHLAARVGKQAVRHLARLARTTVVRRIRDQQDRHDRSQDRRVEGVSASE